MDPSGGNDIRTPINGDDQCLSHAQIAATTKRTAAMQKLRDLNIENDTILVIHPDVLALSGHGNGATQCPLLGVKRTSPEHPLMSAFDPKRTSDVLILL